MNDLAYVIALKASRAARELADIYEMIHTLDSDGVFTDIKAAAAKAMGRIDDLVRQPALDVDDQARSEMERRLEKFGTFL